MLSSINTEQLAFWIFTNGHPFRSIHLSISFPSLIVLLQGGIDVIISEVDEIPSTYLWAKLKRVIPKFGCDVSIRGDMDGIERDTITLDVRANGFPDGTTSLQLSGNAGTQMFCSRHGVVVSAR